MLAIVRVVFKRFDCFMSFHGMLLFQKSILSKSRVVASDSFLTLP